MRLGRDRLAARRSSRPWAVISSLGIFLQPPAAIPGILWAAPNMLEPGKLLPGNPAACCAKKRRRASYMAEYPPMAAARRAAASSIPMLLERPKEGGIISKLCEGRKLGGTAAAAARSKLCEGRKLGGMLAAPKLCEGRKAGGLMAAKSMLV